MRWGVLGHHRHHLVSSSSSLPDRSLSPPHEQLLMAVVGGAIAVVAIVVPWRWGVLGCPHHLVVHPPHHHPPRPGPGCRHVLHCPVVLIFIAPFLSSLLLSFHHHTLVVLWLAPSFLSRCSQFPPASNCLWWWLEMLSSWPLSWSSPIVCCSMLATLQAGTGSGIAIPIISLHCHRCC